MSDNVAMFKKKNWYKGDNLKKEVGGGSTSGMNTVNKTPRTHDLPTSQQCRCAAGSLTRSPRDSSNYPIIKVIDRTS